MFNFSKLSNKSVPYSDSTHNLISNTLEDSIPFNVIVALSVKIVVTLGIVILPVDKSMNSAPLVASHVISKLFSDLFGRFKVLPLGSTISLSSIFITFTSLYTFLKFLISFFHFLGLF